MAESLNVNFAELPTVARISQNVDALDWYLLGRHHWHQRTPESLRRAIEFFEEALAIDPQSAHAYSGLADAHMLLASYAGVDREAAITKAAPAVEAALAIDSELAPAQASLGMLMLMRAEYQQAEAAFSRSIALDPYNDMAEMWLGNTLGALGECRRCAHPLRKGFCASPVRIR